MVEHVVLPLRPIRPNESVRSPPPSRSACHIRLGFSRCRRFRPQWHVRGEVGKLGATDRLGLMRPPTVANAIIRPFPLERLCPPNHGKARSLNRSKTWDNSGNEVRNRHSYLIHSPQQLIFLFQPHCPLLASLGPNLKLNTEGSNYRDSHGTEKKVLLLDADGCLSTHPGFAAFLQSRLIWPRPSHL